MSYTELADDLEVALSDLPHMVAEKRAAAGLSLHAVGAAVGLSYNCVRRCELGHGLSIYAALALLRWLDA